VNLTAKNNAWAGHPGAMMERNNVISEVRMNMKRISRLFGLAALMMLFAMPIFGQGGLWVAPPDSKEYKPTVAKNAESLKMGKDVYMKYCMLCHGEKGDGKGPSGASLPIPPADFTDKKRMAQSEGELAWKIVTGRGMMPAWEPVLSEPEIWSVIHFIKDFAK